MTGLNTRDSELVALGAALASNCVPCIEFHIPAARKAGLSDDEIAAAIGLADKIRQVPARKVLDRALALLPQADAGATAADACGCGDSGTGQRSGGAATRHTMEEMAGMMSKMMAGCGARSDDQPQAGSALCEGSRDNGAECS